MRSPEDLLAHPDFLKGLARGLLAGDEDAASDVVQQTYLAALQQPSPRHPRAWLARVARNFVYRRHRTESRVSAREAAASRPETTAGTAATAARLEIQRRVVAAVEALDEPYRTTIVLRYFDGLQPREIAHRMSSKHETVRTRLRRALAQLRGQLDEEWTGGREAWSLALLPLCDSGLRTGAVTGGLIMTTKTKLALVALPLLGCIVGVAGHASYTRTQTAPAPRATRASSTAVAELQTENERLRKENVTLRKSIAAAHPEVDEAPPSTGTTTAIEWKRYLPVFVAMSKRDPMSSKRVDPAIDKARDELIQLVGRMPGVPSEFLVQDLWRIPVVGGRIAATLAADAFPDLKDAEQLRTEVEEALERSESALPDDALDIERLAGARQAIAASEAILARRTNTDAARRVAAVLDPLWQRDYWQTIYLGEQTADGFAKTVDAMLMEADANTRTRVREISKRMFEGFREMRATLAHAHGEDTLRAVLLEPGKGGANEAVLARRREREDFGTQERTIRAAIAAHQAKFEREYYEALPDAAKKQQRMVAATLFLFDVK